MKKDIEWLKKEIEEYLEYEGVRDARIALESVLGYIDQLDEPEAPVIPQFVADWIEKQMKFGYEDVFISMTRLRERAPEKVKFWFRNNSDTYARAWLDGYEVEKEKLYTVDLPHSYELIKLLHTQTYRIKNYSESGFGDYTNTFTEAEIKAIDERYWAFAKEVTQ